MSDEPASSVPDRFAADEVAARTDWESLQPKEGANYRSHVAQRDGESRLTFDPSFMTKLIVWAVLVFSAISLVIGVVVTIVWLTGAAQNAQGDPGILRFAGPGFMAGALFFGGVAWWLKGKLLTPIVFDRTEGFFWRGSGVPKVGDGKSVRLDDVYSLQMVEKWVKQSGHDTGGYTSYELNLVLRDAQRKNVIDHGDLQALREDANKLADFLNRPLWDTTQD